MKGQLTISLINIGSCSRQEELLHCPVDMVKCQEKGT